MASGLLLVFLLPFMPGLEVAQAQKIPIVTLGHIPRQTTKDGKVIPTPTTRAKVLQFYMLLGDQPNCRITEYKISILAPGKGFWGPMYISGPELTDTIKKKIKETDGPGVKIYISDVKMRYRGTIMDGNNVAVTYDK